MSGAPVRLQKFGHACVRIEAAEAILVIDSGEFSDESSVDGADALLHTHGHYDHLFAERIHRARLARPELEVWSPADAVEACGVPDVNVLAAGAPIEVAGVEVQVTGGRHAPIFPGQDAGENVGLLLPGGIFHPGDALDAPGVAVTTLLLPIQAPWSKLAEVAEFVQAVAPQRAVPIHDALLGPRGVAAFDRNLRAALGETCEYVRLDDGAALDL